MVAKQLLAKQLPVTPDTLADDSLDPLSLLQVQC
jgi:hypothetical protein